ncbi:TonB-linked outer membrane protein, SusC/RagA family [Sinomicrobium oceani]|uniref:TonB-linked outer membrane protein, SusC/RagA family n=2 Tax=Sinomicrobium oceani TaxID=1150368 RepID=A0A1K1MCH5_9FLAO|nr:TonB-linked outer membrane protein, SusC/RagA family [Sinomicrobium oceani]
MRAFIGLFCMVAFGFSSKHGLSQTTVVIDVDTTMTVYQVFSLIKKQTGSTFLYDYEMFKGAPAIRLQKGRIRTGDLLDKIKGTGDFRYAYTEDKTVIFSRAKKKMPTAVTETTPDAQQLRVSGTITDPNGMPLPGVNIIVKDAKRGTMSDPDGKYDIRVNPSDVLVFSYVGFKKQEQAVNGQEVLDVVMEEDVSALDEVVVNAGYYTVKEKEKTGSISKITSQDIETQPVTNVLEAAIGRMPGVQITQNTGVPGGGFTVQIRGQNSLRTDDGANQPLYIVDGVPFSATFVGGALSNMIGGSNPLNSINPSDIESIEVLKDADATAIYGSRGANGVVLITTKQGYGKEGKTRIDIDIQSGIGKVADFLDMLNTEQYLEMRREAFANDKMEPTESNAPELLVWDQNRDNDWQKELIGGTAYITNLQTSVSGGNDQTSFRLGGGLYKETTVYPGDFGYKRISGSLNLNHWSKDRKFQMMFSINYVSGNNELSYNDVTRYAILLPPNTPEFLDDNNELVWPEAMTYNPYAFLRQKYNANTNNLVSNLQLNYQLIPDLYLKTRLGYTKLDQDEIYINPKSTFYPASTAQSSSQFNDTKIKTWIIEPQIEYIKDFGNSKLSILGGATFQEDLRKNSRFNATGFSNEALLESIEAASSITSPPNLSNDIQYRYSAVFGRVNYTLKDRYILNLTGRRDGSSRFGPGKRFANFGAVGAAWIFSNENFLQNFSFLSYGKLRGSYGTTGNDRIDDYGYLDSWGPSQYPYKGENGLEPTGLFNPDYVWERNVKLEGALELGFLNDRIFIQASYYHNRSDNQLLRMPLPSSVGFSSVQGNLPATVQNTGWEVEFNSTNIKDQDFTWASAFNLTVPRNKLIDFPGIENTSYANQYEVGKSLYVQKLYHFLGVDPETGTYQVEDLNEDGVLSPTFDYQGLKEIAQDFYGGFQNNFTYKNWQLNIFFQFVRQTGRNYLFGGFSPPGYRLNNQPDIVMDRWQNQGDVLDIQKFTQSTASEAGQSYYLNLRRSDAMISDASFIRLKNVSIHYMLPKTTAQKIGIRNCRFYIQGQNLLTFTNFLGMNPENQNLASLPPLRKILGGVQLSF